MRVLLDECIDWRLSRALAEHQVRTAHQMGWATIKNGELLRLASQHFEVFVTVDRNLHFQQNIQSMDLAVVVLCASSNRLTDLLPLVPDLLLTIASVQPGRTVFLGR